MNVRFATGDEILNWDSLILKNQDGGNVFQSAELAETKRRGGWTPRYIMAGNHAVTVLEKKALLTGLLWYLPKGPGVTTLETLEPLIPALKDFAQKNHVFTVKIEPEILESSEVDATLRQQGLVKTRAIQPNSSTVIINLAPSLEEIMASFNQKGRHALHRAERDGVTTTPVDCTVENMTIMFRLLAETAAGRFDSSLRSFEYYQTFWKHYADSGHGSLFFAYFNGEVVASAFCVYLGQKGLYKDGASVRKKTAYGASHLLQWEVMRWMKQRGVTSYDLCGSPHSSQIENPDNSFHGIGRFKTSFNKHVTDYIGCYDIIADPAAYKRWQKYGERITLSLSWRLKHQQWY